MSCRGGPIASGRRQEFSKISAKDAARFVQVDDQLKKLARYLQPFFMEPPPEIRHLEREGLG